MVYHTPRKRFGQNFLHDQNVIQKIVAAVNPHPGENLVEIGPGHGALTCQLLPLVEEMHAIELDRDLIPLLESTCQSIGKLTIHSRDVLRFDFSELYKDGSPLRIVGNLPYNISTPLIFHILQNGEFIKDMHFMLQKEVVERISALPGGSNYGRLSIMVQRFCRVERILTIGPGAFNPPPKVDSSVIRLTPWNTPPVNIDDDAHFNKLVTAAFSQRRKTLRNSLKSMVSMEQFEITEIDPVRRAETLSLEEFAKLANATTNENLGK